MIQFYKRADEKNSYDISTVLMSIDSSGVSLAELLAEFGYFLRAIGYSFSGNIEIVDDEPSRPGEE